jgi:hypothetical protein
MAELKEQKPNYLYFSQDFFEILLAKLMTKIWHDQLVSTARLTTKVHAWIHFSSVNDGLHLFCMAKARVSPRDLYYILQRTYVRSTEVSGNHY